MQLQITNLYAGVCFLCCIMHFPYRTTPTMVLNYASTDTGFDYSYFALFVQQTKECILLMQTKIIIHVLRRSLTLAKSCPIVNPCKHFNLKFLLRSSLSSRSLGTQAVTCYSILLRRTHTHKRARCTMTAYTTCSEHPENQISLPGSSPQAQQFANICSTSGVGSSQQKPGHWVK